MSDIPNKRNGQCPGISVCQIASSHEFSLRVSYSYEERTRVDIVIPSKEDGVVTVTYGLQQQ